MNGAADRGVADETYGVFIGGRWTPRASTIEVRNPLDGRLVARVSAGGPSDVGAAVDAARASLAVPFPVHERYDILMATADLIEASQEGYASAIAQEGSKTIREARREPPRAAAILRLSAEEGRRLAGETLPFDSRAGSENRVGYYFRFPVGVIAAITPFNDPLAMVAHKVGPAIAAGNAVVLKPASATPLSALRFAEDLAAAGLPAGRLNVVPGSGGEVGEALVAHPDVRLVTFTGGVATGERITRLAGLKKLSMELGSNSPVIVLADADLDRAVPAIAAGAFAQAGQNCLGVQRVFVHEALYEAFKARFVPYVSRLTAGSSLDESVDVCAMIDRRQAERVEGWIREAVDGGARILAGGRAEGALVWPTVLEGTPAGARLDVDEAYGPVVSLYSVRSLDEGIDRANAVTYGLHAAIFTERLRDAFAAVRRLEVGAVMVNDSTDYRLDIMPFGGTKRSGIGREGIRFACQEMTETRVVCLNL
ncbi:MAG TPA: aldehyde dehydrogenase family protein [Vicinamibacterales bacterium]|nr:aldehyde dehydrogenase family protein [Vicinamibacterales bacterium]